MTFVMTELYRGYDLLRAQGTHGATRRPPSYFRERRIAVGHATKGSHGHGDVGAFAVLIVDRQSENAAGLRLHVSVGQFFGAGKERPGDHTDGKLRVRRHSAVDRLQSRFWYVPRQRLLLGPVLNSRHLILQTWKYPFIQVLQSYWLHGGIQT
ncbi:hypothetical protein TMatcc_007710 [Talaromyces marneffei ATCC 18224]